MKGENQHEKENIAEFRLNVDLVSCIVLFDFEFRERDKDGSDDVS